MVLAARCEWSLLRAAFLKWPRRAVDWLSLLGGRGGPLRPPLPPPAAPRYTPASAMDVQQPRATPTGLPSPTEEGHQPAAAAGEGGAGRAGKGGHGERGRRQADARPGGGEGGWGRGRQADARPRGGEGGGGLQVMEQALSFLQRTSEYITNYNCYNY